MTTRRHDTPEDVAWALARHAPRRFGTILDPSVGTGALLRPLLGAIARNDACVTCVDSDSDALEQVRQTLGGLPRRNVSIVEADFLSWSNKIRRRFDCIVMNPPFAGRREDLYRLEAIEDGLVRTRFVSIEAAFVHKALDLLVDYGRLLTVLPCSVVMAESAQWLRDRVFRLGAVRFVHELPPRTFSGVESRMYLCVFEKTSRQKRVMLLNHDLEDPERVSVSLTNKGAKTRLDFGYHRSYQRLELAKQVTRYGWQPLRDIVDIFRGDIGSPIGPEQVVHTTDYADGFWWKGKRHNESVFNDPEKRIRSGDILLKRVGRNCYLTVGRPVGLKGMSCSDCVLILRPKNRTNSAAILLALRVLGATGWTKALLERGTGASYVSHESLLDLQIPTRLGQVCKKNYGAFCLAQSEKAIARSERIVANLARSLTRMTARLCT
jgi:tRNA1(Val) A37 N6-methylase TrmN6